tara:strand:+ start:16 stop:237 length:222 start_codon:yes stop_codon:yes gene_type:complete
MGIKSKSSKLEKGISSFPKLMKCKESTVLFVSETEGFVVNGSCMFGYSIGYWSESWIPDKFEDYSGTITLENE